MPEDNALSAHPPLPQLNKLRELRNVLVALKGPLAEKPGLRESIERDFFNNEVNDRVLGKRVVAAAEPARLRPAAKRS